MSTLPNFTPVSQLTTITEDGLPNSDSPYECVATSILMGVMQQLGITQVGGKFTPDYLKDQAYNEGFYGGTSAIKYVDVCASLGVKLWAFNGIPGQLVSEAHKQLQAGFGVVFTQPDPYVSASLNWSHVCIFFSEQAGSLTALDPYICKSIKRTDAEWENMLEFNQIWITEKIQEEEMRILDLTTPGVSQYFELGTADGSQWKCRQNGNIVQGGILAFYRKFGGDALCGLTYLGLPLSDERTLIGGASDARRQYFERGCIAFESTAPHRVDTPPGSGEVYMLKLYEGVNGQDPAVSQLEAEIATLKSLQGSTVIQAELVAAEAKIANAVKALS